jgi:hypothetical protein
MVDRGVSLGDLVLTEGHLNGGLQLLRTDAPMSRDFLNVRLHAQILLWVSLLSQLLPPIRMQINPLQSV